MTETTRGKRHRSKRLASGVSRKLIRIASASGRRISFARCKAAMATTKAASVSRGDEELRTLAMRLAGTESPHFQPIFKSADSLDAKGVLLGQLLQMIAGNRPAENHPVVIDFAAYQREGGVTGVIQGLD